MKGPGSNRDERKAGAPPTAVQGAGSLLLSIGPRVFIPQSHVWLVGICYFGGKREKEIERGRGREGGRGEGEGWREEKTETGVLGVCSVPALSQHVACVSLGSVCLELMAWRGQPGEDMLGSSWWVMEAEFSSPRAQGRHPKLVLGAASRGRAREGHPDRGR